MTQTSDQKDTMSVYIGLLKEFTLLVMRGDMQLDVKKSVQPGAWLAGMALFTATVLDDCHIDRDMFLKVLAAVPGKTESEGGTPPQTVH